MKPVLKAFGVLVALAALLGAIGLWYFMHSGVSAKEQPGHVEEFVARRVRNMAIAGRARSLTNPIEYSAEIVCRRTRAFRRSLRRVPREQRQWRYPHGSWHVAQGPGLAPGCHTGHSPTASCSGLSRTRIRFTGMPGWGTGTKDGEKASWHLVHFIRRLPNSHLPSSRRWNL